MQWWVKVKVNFDMWLLGSLMCSWKHRGPKFSLTVSFVSLCTIQMIFPVMVFLGLKNNDCCGCCGNESCGRRFAVSEFIYLFIKRGHAEEFMWKKYKKTLLFIFYVCSSGEINFFILSKLRGSRKETVFMVSLTELLLSTISLIVLNKLNTSGAVRILCNLHSSKCKIKHTATSKLMRSCLL